VPTSGNLEIAISTLGASPDPGMYAIFVDGISHPVNPTDTLELSGLTAADHEVELTGVPSQCTTQGRNQRIVPVSPETTTRLAFQVLCPVESPGGSLEVTVVTAGSAPDADGYTLQVDDGSAMQVAATDTLALPDVQAGPHSLRLESMAPNCEVRGDNPRNVDVPQATETRFDVTCVPPASQAIIYTSDRVADDAIMDIFQRNPDGTGLVNLTNTPAEDEREPVWSPDGLQIAFVPFDRNEILVMDAHGANRRVLISGLSFANGVQWSPDGNLLLFSRDNAASVSELATLTLSSRQLRVLARAPDSGQLTGFRWSPDGSRVAFSVVDFGPNPKVSSIATGGDSGGGPTVLLAVTDQKLSVGSWSPDGTTIAYTAERSDGRRDIYLMAADGTSPPTNLTNSPGLYGNLTWAPDGRTLAFTNGDQFGKDLFTITPDGALVRLTDDQGDYEGLGWSRDGSRLLFSFFSSLTFSFEISYVNFDGTGRRTVTADGFLNGEASWRP
jgi:Tol biopolymer transport system component